VYPTSTQAKELIMDNKVLKPIIGGCLVVLLMVVGIIAVQAQEGQPGAGNQVFIPITFNGTGHTIAGRVLNAQNDPIPGVKIQTDHGQSTITDQNGDYSLERLGEGTYLLTPSLGGTEFSPPSSSVVVPPDVIKLNFTANVVCSEAIVNGGFESNSSWEFPVTEYPAGYSTDQAHAGSRSARTGITNPGDNRYSYSSTRQLVSIPSNASSALLTFWLKSYSAGMNGLALPKKPEIGMPADQVQLAGDVQYALMLDTNFNTIGTLIWQLSNSQTWTQYQFDLSGYKGKTFYLHFGTYNDGLSGISSMFVDDVSLDICPGGGSPTPSPTPGLCSNLFQNSSFETKSYWEIPITVYPAGYSTSQHHTGSWSMRTGITNPVDNVYSYSDFRQAVRIPTYAPISKAGFWLYTLSGEARNLSAPDQITPTGRPFSETTLSGDLQYVLVLDQYQNWIDTLVWQRTDEGYWHYYEFDLRRYAGYTIYLQFGTYNDGGYGITSMYVDDVTLFDCVSTPTPGPSPTPTRTPTAPPTPTKTPTPGPCQELLINNNFEGNNGWVIPITVYPAAYSNAQYHSAWRSMRTGIVNPADNVYSYSDFRQTVYIPWNANHVTLEMWMYPISGEVLGNTLPPKPAIGSTLREIQMSGDVQYLLVMDSNYNILDVLIWQLSDSQVWDHEDFDLSIYRGWTILLQWGTYNDGGGGISAMYVDDVTLKSCP
jgi:hypothetical protein